MVDRVDREGPAPGGYTRRSFFRDIGRAGGAAVMYNMMAALGLFRGAAEAKADDRFVPLTGDGPGAGVVILGGGIAGLTAAYELLKGGYAVTVLEPRSRPGGRNWTARGGTREAELGGPLQECRFAPGLYMNAGPARIPQDHITIDYCRELGVELEVFANANANGYYFNENTPSTDYGPLASTPTRHRTAKADFYGYTSELLAKCVDRGALDAQLSRDDRELLISFLRQLGALRGSSLVYKGGSRRGYAITPGAGDEPGAPLDPPPSLSDVLKSRFGQNFAFELGWEQAMLMFQPVGGMDRIPYAFERAILERGGQILYGCKADRISSTPAGVEISFTDLVHGGAYRVAADYCVCTIPPTVLRKIAADFSPGVKAALAAIRPTSAVKVGLEYSRRFWEIDERILGGITHTNLNIRTIWYPSSGYLSPRGVVIGAYNVDDDADRYAALSPERRVEEAVEQGMKVHGAPYRDELASGFSAAWSRVEYSEGAWVDWPDERGEEYALLNEPDGNIYFAGDYLSYLVSWQAGAIHSARRAVGALHERALATARRDGTERLVRIA